MSSGSLLYQKGDLVTIKQASLAYQKTTSSNGSQKKRFWNLQKPISGVFLGFLTTIDELDELEYLQSSASMKSPCRIAVGESIYYVDEKSFFFHIQRS